MASLRWNLVFRRTTSFRRTQQFSVKPVLVRQVRSFYQQNKKMGQGEERKTREQPNIQIQERGEIFFFYRPKVNRDEVYSVDDVQKLYVVLRPESGDRAVEEKQSPDSGKEGVGNSEPKEDDHSKKDGGGHGSQEVNIEKETLLRLMVMGRKSLPDPSKKTHRPYWGFVELVTTKIDDVKETLQATEYETATRGRRHLPPARPLAEGVYRILKHWASEKQRQPHTHLVYKLEYPSPSSPEKHEPQEALNIGEEASFLIQIKNPSQPAPANVGLQSKRKAIFPAHLQGLFGSKRYSLADPPDFLNYEGCEFLLIPASDDIEEELGLELKGVEEEDSSDPACADLIRTFGEVGPIKPLIEGSWA